MAGLTDMIENFIKEMLNEQREVELKRNELATFFDCAPSQINYVLTSRFTFENGYVIESKRGGGGYIRIVRLTDNENYDFILQLLEERLSEPLGEKSGEKIVESLKERNVISEGEARILSIVLKDETLGIPSQEMRNLVRGRILKQVVIHLLNAGE